MRFVDPYPFNIKNLTRAENYREMRHLLPDSFSNYTTDVPLQSQSLTESEKEDTDVTTEITRSSSMLWEDTNLVYHGDDNPACRNAKIALYHAGIFRDSQRPFSLKFPIHIKYGKYPIQLGTTVTTEYSAKKPKVAFEAEDRLYTLLLTDIDNPVPESPSNRESVHWAVTNIPGDNIYMGEEVVPYRRPMNLIDTHRMVFTLYEHTRGYLKFKEFTLFKFDQTRFSKLLALKPVACTYFKHKGMILSERDFGKQFKNNEVLSSSDDDPFLDRMKKLTKSLVHNASVWSRAAGHDLSTRRAVTMRDKISRRVIDR